MVSRSAVDVVRAWPTTQRRAALSVILAVSFALGFVAIFVTLPGSEVAAWWPAAGVSVIAVLAARGPRWRIALAVWAVGIASNYVAGRPLAISVCFGFANALEAWIVATVIEGDDGGRRIDSLGSIGRFLIAILCGSVAIGVIVGITVLVFDGGNMFDVIRTVTPSHASAILTVTPIALASRLDRAPGSRAELALQGGTLIAALLLVFWPGQSQPLTFLILPVLTWAALRFGMRLVALEILVAAAFATGMTSLGGGIFARAGAEGVYLQVFLIAHGSCILFLAAARSGRQRVVERLAASERLLRGGILGATIGMAIFEEFDDRRACCVEGNATAFDLLGIDLEFEDAPTGPAANDERSAFAVAFRDFVDSDRREWTGRLHDATAGRDIDLFMARVRSAEGASHITVQAIDVTARAQSERATVAALDRERDLTERLREINREQDDFVSSVSHELRTPITSIVGFAEELADSGLDAQQQTFTSVITRNAHRLAILVEDLLELGRISAQDHIRPPGPVPIDRVIADCIEEFTPQARDRGITLSSWVDPPAIGFRSSPRDLARIVSNLVTNAVKFTPSGGTVAVNCRRDGDDVTISVSDTGIGIPPVELSRIFGRFYRSANADGISGAGLGLSLVKALVTRLGGEVAVESTLGAGTSVTVTFPFAGADQPSGATPARPD